MIKRFFKTIFTIILTFLLMATPLVVYINTPVAPKEAILIIEKGMTLRQIVSKLEVQGIVQHRWLFLIYAHLMGESGSLKAGEYLFDKPTTPYEVLDHLAHGLVETVKVRLIEGWTLNQIDDYLGGLASIKTPGFKQDILRLSKDPTFIQTLGLDVSSLEGYLFPETYYLPPDATPSDYLRTFVKEFWKKYQEAVKNTKTLPTLSQHQIVTLASLIEKETGTESERQIISSVFHNRLAKGMLLQSDPTVIYGLKNFDGDIRKADLSNRHPYNTYVHAGLPPGPICNPGLPSIKAALQPTQTDYLYFVSKKNGTHYFSRTAGEHAEAVRKFQLGQTEE